MTDPTTADDGVDFSVLSAEQLAQLNRSVFGPGEDNERLREAVLAEV